MDIKKIGLFVVVFFVSGLAGYLIFGGGRSFVDSTVEVDWRLLGELDYISGVAKGELEKLDGQEVKIPGFMVPLEDDQRSVTEFLLVPAPQMCIHVPPPPPNQMVLVEMGKNSNTGIEFGPVWVYGKLKITSKRHFYGETSFVMEGKEVRPYR